MRVLIVNTSERAGGAAVAAGRLLDALTTSGVKAKMLVRKNDGRRPSVSALPGRWLPMFHFLWERLVIWAHMRFTLNRKKLFTIDIANSGTDITRLPEFREADIIHLHWVNQGMLSLRGIRRILDTGKPVVWTMHDIWPAASICHLTLGCRRFESSCCHCRLLPNGGADDLSAKTWRRKQRMLDGRQITFVGCSEWLAGEARRSALLKGQQVVSIPNPIDTNIYCPGSQQAARRSLGLPLEGRVILFVAQRADNPYKGMDYLVEACRLLATQHPEQSSHIAVAVLGGHAEETRQQLPFRTYPLGYVSDERRIVQVYRAADVFVLPSLSENLPNTIMESMACGVPAVAFHVGGIPEEIDHKENGYVAEYRNSIDLAQGLWWTLFEADHDRLRQHCLDKVARCYSQQQVAERYISLYESINRHHHL